MKPITIIIPTYNRSRALEAVWPSYRDQPLVEKIVIVNDGGRDDTPELAGRLARDSKTPVQSILHPERRGQQAARRTGIAAAETDWVLFGEDDVWLDSEYPSILLREAGLLGADIIAGRLVPVRVPGAFSADLIRDRGAGRSGPGRVFDMRNLAADYARPLPEPIPAPHLHSISLIKRSLFSRVCFDSYYAGSGQFEETDLYLSATAAGAKMFLTPRTVCYHLRGPLCASGGQRVNRWAFEYYMLKNAAHLVSKHWPLLKTEYGFRGAPWSWVAGFMVRREWAQLKRVLRGDARSSLKGK